MVRQKGKGKKLCAQKVDVARKGTAERSKCCGTRVDAVGSVGNKVGPNRSSGNAGRCHYMTRTAKRGRGQVTW